MPATPIRNALRDTAHTKNIIDKCPKLRQLLFILSGLATIMVFGQPKLKEITEYYPTTLTVKNHYFVIKPEKEVYHGVYEVYRTNGQLEERGYFDHGVKTSFLKFDSKGRVVMELLDSVLTTNIFFPNGELKSTRKTKNKEPLGIWETYDLNECDKPYLISSTEYLDNLVISKTESINNMFLGIFSVNTLVTKDSHGNSDTTLVSTNCDVIYPSEARRNQVEGTLFIKINLTDDCELNYELINEIGYGIENQFIDKLELTKQNIQANQNCRDIEITVPIKFELQ